jgi:hypothetical protein
MTRNGVGHVSGPSESRRTAAAGAARNGSPARGRLSLRLNRVEHPLGRGRARARARREGRSATVRVLKFNALSQNGPLCRAGPDRDRD